MKSSLFLACLILSALGANCGSADSASQGTEKAPCYPNQTCNAGLTCFSGICVNAGTAGTSGTGSGGSSGTGGGSNPGFGGSGGSGPDARTSAAGNDGQPDGPDAPASADSAAGAEETGGATDGPKVRDGIDDGVAADGSTGLDLSLSDGSPFPMSPILDPNSPSPVPSNPETQFPGLPTGTGPCVVEPENGALYPNNWTRPRISWKGTGGLVQITVHAAGVPNDLVVYTTGNYWIMDRSIWTGLSQQVQEQDISVTVRSAAGGATTVAFQIAPVGAAGSIVFLALDPAAVGNQDAATP